MWEAICWMGARFIFVEEQEGDITECGARGAALGGDSDTVENLENCRIAGVS